MDEYKIVRALENELNKKHIDWDVVKRIIEENKSDINEHHEWESALSDCYYYFENNGKDAVTLTKLFLKNGFDVTENDGHNGASCLHQLCWSFYDQYILDVAELLLDAGADPIVKKSEDDEDGVMDSIEWKLDYWAMGEMTDCPAEYYDSANIFEAYYVMVDRALNHKDYHGVRAFRASVGYRVDKIEEITVLHPNKEESSMRKTLLFYADGIILAASDFVDFVINPYIKEDAIECRDVSEDYRDIIGSRIKGLRYLKASQAVLSFDNGHKMRFEGHKGGCKITVV